MRNRRRASALMTLATLVLVGALGLTHAGALGAALSAVLAWVVVLAVALHLATLGLRSEAWRLSLAAGGGDRLTRDVLHGANAAAFAAGTMQSQAALPARVAVRRRAGGDRAPRPTQICVADVPIFALELCATALLLAAGVLANREWWIAGGALAVAGGVLLAAGLGPGRLRPGVIARGLAMLADRRRRGALLTLVAAIVALSVTRVWLVLLACGLPHDLGEVAWVFATVGVSGCCRSGRARRPAPRWPPPRAISRDGRRADARRVVDDRRAVYALLVALAAQVRSGPPRRCRAA